MRKQTEHPHKRQHMVSGSDYYRNRADVERGLKKKDFPSIEQSDPSQNKQDKAVDADRVPKR